MHYTPNRKAQALKRQAVAQYHHASVGRDAICTMPVSRFTAKKGKSVRKSLAFKHWQRTMKWNLE